MRCHECDEKSCSQGNPCRETDSLSLYSDEERRLMNAAAEVETLYYGELNRLQEIGEFARRLGVTRIGIAFCVGLADEVRLIAEAFEAAGLEVRSVCCKVGSLTKEEMGMPVRPWVGAVSCNPAEQARILDDEGCGLLVVVGLCVGHDTLFYRHAKAPVTTLVTKDRKLGHNPVAAVTCPYIRKRLNEPPRERQE